MAVKLANQFAQELVERQSGRIRCHMVLYPEDSFVYICNILNCTTFAFTWCNIVMCGKKVVHVAQDL